MSSLNSRTGSTMLCFGIIFVTIAITPWNNLDPVSVTKLFITSLLSFIALVFALFATNENKIPILRILFNFWILFSIAIVGLNLMLRPQFFSERILGIYGRNLGAIFIISMFIILWSSFKLLSINHLGLMLRSIKISGCLVSLYFVIQKMGFDKALWIDSYGGIPSSTMGNPNFVSSIVAIGLVSTLPIVFFKETQMKIRLILLLIGGVELWVIKQSESIQGFVITAFALATITLVQILTFLSRRGIRSNVFFGTLTGAPLLLAATILSFLGPINVQNSTLEARIDYWRAGLSMILDSPLRGQGLDYFGESYFQFRSESAALRSPGLFTDSAHNYFIDFGSFGGLPLLTVFSIPLIFVIFKVMKRCFFVSHDQQTYSKPNAIILGLMVAWLGFFLQSLVSPMSHPLMYLGMVLTGLLCSIDLENPKDFEKINRNNSLSTNASRPKLASKLNIRSFVVKSVVVLTALSIPIAGAEPMIVDAKFRDAIEQGNGDKLLELALNKPLNFHHMEMASQIFLDNNHPELALRIVRTMAKENPGNIRGWRRLRDISPSLLERERAGEMMLKLDPLNAELNKELSATP